VNPLPVSPEDALVLAVAALRDAGYSVVCAFGRHDQPGQVHLAREPGQTPDDAYLPLVRQITAVWAKATRDSRSNVPTHGYID